MPASRAAAIRPRPTPPPATRPAAFEVAFLDLQGQLTGRSVAELLGGAVRDRVPYSAYLFYKFARHKNPVHADDRWGEVLTHDQMVGEARRMIGEFGFGSLKLK